MRAALHRSSQLYCTPLPPMSVPPLLLQNHRVLSAPISSSASPSLTRDPRNRSPALLFFGF